MPVVHGEVEFGVALRRVDLIVGHHTRTWPLRLVRSTLSVPRPGRKTDGKLESQLYCTASVMMSMRARGAPPQSC